METSRDLTWAIGIDAPNKLRREADALDARTMATFAAASVIIGVVAALQNNIVVEWEAIPFAIALGAYVLVFGLSIYSLYVRKFAGPDNPETLREDYWNLPVEEAEKYLWEYTENAYSTNNAHVQRKGRALLIMVPALFVEVGALLVWLAISA